MLPQVSRAGEWFLRSGVQTPEGGVARYYGLEPARYLAVSTEITGYSASALGYLHSLTGDQRYLDRARTTARFLTACWDGETKSMPFEIAPAQFTYFFDCGIIVRGLLTVWRATGESALLETACAVGDSMARDFAGPDGQIHPILSLPDKQALPVEPLRWSRAPGCYQLKSGLAWWDLWQATGEARYRQSYEALLAASLRTYTSFLPGHWEQRKVVDRLHAFTYFLEGMLPHATNPQCAHALGDGIQRVAKYLRELAPALERADVYAQLLRVRFFADCAGAVPLDANSAAWETEQLRGFAAVSDDPRVDGGFYFGRTGTAWEPFVNPVSTAFALQALAMADGGRHTPLHHLI